MEGHPQYHMSMTINAFEEKKNAYVTTLGPLSLLFNLKFLWVRMSLKYLNCLVNI